MTKTSNDIPECARTNIKEISKSDVTVDDEMTTPILCNAPILEGSPEKIAEARQRLLH